MILFPRELAPLSGPNGICAAWEAVELTQTARSGQWWLIAQPDHAALAGELAARADSAVFPEMDARVLKAIALHDAGWTPYDGGRPQGTGTPESVYPAPMIGPDSRPISFLDVATEQSVAAWVGSIEKALEDSHLAGRLVSEHFSRIAQLGISRAASARDRSLLNAFICREAARQKELQKHLSQSREQTSALVDMLQFFDLLSLYACCGSLQNVEFPQRVQGQPICLFREGGRAWLKPRIFPDTVTLNVPAREYSMLEGIQAETIVLSVVFG